MKKLKLITILLVLAMTVGCARQQRKIVIHPEPASSMNLYYAKGFTVDYFDGGSKLITIGKDRYLVVPEYGAVPDGIDSVIVLHQPLESVYLAASSAMDFFRALDSLDAVTLTSTESADWSIPEVRQALDSGEMLYAGHYSEPDYELLLQEETQVAIESTMIYHSPETSEALNQIAIPMLVERSSYESDPIGRMEWIKMYGVLLGKEKEARDYFNEQVEAVQDILDREPVTDGPTVAFFYITANGQVNVRKPSDYVPKLIEMAGGRYILDDLESDDNNLSTTNIELEAFYEAAKDADIIIYNSNIDGDIQTIDQLLSKSELLGDFKAVQNGNVWCTSHSLFQETTGVAALLRDLDSVISGEVKSGELRFLHSVE